MNIGMAIIIAIVVGLIIGLIAALVEKSKLKTVRKDDTAADYIVKDSMKVTGSSEHFLYKETERTERPRENEQNGGPGQGGPRQGGPGGPGPRR